MNTHELKIERTVKAPRLEVYKTFTEKTELEKWFCPEGMSAVIDELEVKEGGAIQVTMISDSDGGKHTARGTYREVREPEKLVFSWQWITEEPGEGTETLVTIELKESESGTDLSFTHSGFANEKACDMHNEGWQSAFKRFDKVIS